MRFMAATVPKPDGDRLVIVGTYTEPMGHVPEGSGAGLSTWFLGTDYELKPAGDAVYSRNPSALLCVGSNVYACNEYTDDIDGKPVDSATISAFSLTQTGDAVSGEAVAVTLQAVGSPVSSAGTAPCNLVAPVGGAEATAIIGANYCGGNVVLYARDPTDGSLAVGLGSGFDVQHVA